MNERAYDTEDESDELTDAAPEEGAGSEPADLYDEGGVVTAGLPVAPPLPRLRRCALAEPALSEAEGPGRTRGRSGRRAWYPARGRRTIFTRGRPRAGGNILDCV